MAGAGRSSSRPSSSSLSSSPLPPLSPAFGRSRFQSSGSSLTWSSRYTTGQSPADDAITDWIHRSSVVLSPDESDSAHFAQETPFLVPSAHRGEAKAHSHEDGVSSWGSSRGDGRDGMTRIRTAPDVDDRPQIVIHRFGLDADDILEAVADIDIELFSDLMPPSPRGYTAVYLAAADLFKTLLSTPQDHDNAPSEIVIRRIVEASAQGKGSVNHRQAIFCDDMPAFFQQRGVSADQLPPGVTCFAASPIQLPCSGGKGGHNDDDDSLVTVGAAVSFRCGTDNNAQIERVVRSLARSSQTSLSNRFLARRRAKEQEQQLAIVKLMRLTQAEFGLLPTLKEPNEEDPLPVSNFDPDLEGHFFQKAVDSIETTLDADAVVLLDLSGFKVDQAAYAAERESQKEQRTLARHSSAVLNRRGSAPLSGNHTSSDSAEDRDSRVESSGLPLDKIPSSLLSNSIPDPGSDGKQSTKSSAVVDDAQAGGTSKSESSQATTSSDQPHDAVVCSYSSSSKPIPLLASTGSATEHFEKLSGSTSRPLVARFLALVASMYLRKRPQKKKGSAFAAISPDPTPTQTSFIRDLLPAGFPTALTLPLLESSGQPSYLIVCAFSRRPTPFEDSDRTFLEMIGSVLIASSLRIHSEAVDRAQVQITQRMQHSLRTPLHSIVGICESAGAQLEPTDGNRRLISSIGLSAEALDATISDVLDYNVLAGIKEPSIASSSTWPLVSFRGLYDTVNRVSLSAWRLHCLSKTWLQEDPRKIPPPPELFCSTGPDSWVETDDKCRFDAEALTRITSKVVCNALQATKNGIVAVRLCVKEAEQDASKDPRGVFGAINTLHLSVRDTGCGMSEEFLRSGVFRTFTQGLSGIDQANGGPGLSLSICSALMLRLGGRIHVSSEEGKGTKIDLTFPFRGSASAPTKPSNLKVAVIRDKAEKGKSFLAFCHELCQQFGAQMLGDATESPRLLVEAQLVLIAGEATSEPSKRREVARLLKSQPAKASDAKGGTADKGKQRLCLELPNRAYSDMPSSLQPERKQVMIDDVQAISIHRPFTLPDLEVLEEIFDGTFAEQRKRGCTLHKVSRGSQRGSPASSPEGSDEKPPFAPGAGRPESGPSQGESRRSSESTTRSISEPQASGVSRTDTEHQGTPHPPRTKGAGQSQPQPNASDAPPSSDKLPGHQKRPFQCLVVEDNDLNLRILTQSLKRAGVRYLEARDGVEAVEAFTSSLPQVVLLDINMPRMDGFEAARRMREVPCPDYYPRIVAVTALSQESDKLKGFDCGIDDWMTKPVRLAQLASDVRQWKEELEKADQVEK